MRWHNREINNQKFFDSKDLSEDTQRIRTDLIREKLAEEAQRDEYREEYLAYQEQLKKQKKHRVKLLMIAFFVLCIIGLLMWVFLFRKYTHISEMERDVAKLISEKQYEKAGSLYKKLYEETDNPQYIEKYKVVTSISNNIKLFKEAQKEINNSNYENAIEILLTIHSDDTDEIERITAMINQASDRWLENIRNLYLSNDMKNAINEVNKFVNLLPDNILGMKLRSVIVNKLSINEFDVGIPSDHKINE